MVEHVLPKHDVAGSNPVVRSADTDIGRFTRPPAFVPPDSADGATKAQGQIQNDLGSAGSSNGRVA